MISSNRISDGLEISEGCFALGASSECKLTEFQLQALAKFLEFASPTSVLKSFKRRKTGSRVLHSRSYERVYSRNSFTVRVTSITHWWGQVQKTH